MRIRRLPIRPTRIHFINTSQIRRGPKLEIIAPEIIRPQPRTRTLIITRFIPMHCMVMFAKVQFRVVAVRVAVCELVVGGVEGVGDGGVGAAATAAVDFENNVVADPCARGTGGSPADGGPFPVGFVADVFLEVYAVVYALSRGG